MPEPKTVPEKVIFRKFEGGEIIALFPEQQNVDTEGKYIGSYQHIGQHGAANPELIWKLSKPTYGEYEPLLQELISIGYEPEVLGDREVLQMFPIPLPI